MQTVQSRIPTQKNLLRLRYSGLLPSCSSHARAGTSQLRKANVPEPAGHAPFHPRETTVKALAHMPPGPVLPRVALCGRTPPLGSVSVNTLLLSMAAMRMSVCLTSQIRTNPGPSVLSIALIFQAVSPA